MQTESSPSNNQAPPCNDIIPHSKMFGFKLVGDNLDISVIARYLRAEKHCNQSMHFFHSYAVLDRIAMGNLSIELPATCNPRPLDMALSLLPTEENDSNILSNFATLISRVLVTHIPFFQFAFSDVVVWHIHHKHYKEMSSKSKVVS